MISDALLQTVVPDAALAGSAEMLTASRHSENWSASRMSRRAGGLGILGRCMDSSFIGTKQKMAKQKAPLRSKDRRDAFAASLAF